MKLSVLLAVLAAGVGGLDRAGGWRLSQLVPVRSGEYAEAKAVSGRGEVVGVWSTEGASWSFLWQNGKLTRLRLATADAINDRGEIAGTTVAAATTHAVVWRNGKTTDLRSLAGRRGSSFATGISNDGRVVGTSDTADGHRHAFLWRAGKMIDLGTLGGDDSAATAINERGQVVGFSQTADGIGHAFLWQNGVMRNLGGLGQPNFSSAAYAINDRGQIVGSDESTGAAFLWENGKMRNIGKALRTASVATAINNRGVVVGYTNTFVDDPLKNDPRDHDRHALVWQNGHVARLSPTESRFRASIPAAINDQNVVVGRVAYLDQYNEARPAVWRPN